MNIGLRKKRLRNQLPILNVCKDEALQNAASMLLANIRFSSVDEPIKLISITSSIPNEGKTTSCLSLALAMGATNSKILVVEGDMRRRSLRGTLKVKTRHGIHAVLTGKCELEDAVVGTDFSNVYFLDSEAGIPNPDGILSSKRYSDLLLSLRESYDYVLVDTPPISAFPDAAIISSKVDGVILVARVGYTEKSEIVAATAQLRAAGANILGVVLNCVSTSAGGGYGYYYNYYYYYDKEGKKHGTKDKDEGMDLNIKDTEKTKPDAESKSSSK